MSVKFSSVFRVFFLLVMMASAIVGLGAQEEATAGEEYLVSAGNHIGVNLSMNFAPRNLRVHRGDTVTWAFSSPHNVRFSNDGWMTLVIAPEVEGRPLPQLNPEVAFPNIENGGVYTGGTVNSGMPMETPVFSLEMDVEPGIYTYVCDLHPGMYGTIEVVADEEAVPSPAETVLQGQMETMENIHLAEAALAAAKLSYPSETTDGILEVAVGLTVNNVFVSEFVPSVAVIKAGESVQWNVEQNNFELLSVSSVDLVDGNFIVPMVMAEGAPPMLTLGEIFNRSTEDGAEIVAGQSFNSGLLGAGESYTLRFMEPGIYHYGGLLGEPFATVVVLPAA